MLLTNTIFTSINKCNVMDKTDNINGEPGI